MADIFPRIYLIYDGEVYTPPSVIWWKNKGGWNYAALNSLPSLSPPSVKFGLPGCCLGLGWRWKLAKIASLSPTRFKL